jgi:hypothetical protein
MTLYSPAQRRLRPRVGDGRRRAQINRAFIISGGQPLSTTEMVERACPRGSSHVPPARTLSDPALTTALGYQPVGRADAVWARIPD